MAFPHRPSPPLFVFLLRLVARAHHMFDEMSRPSTGSWQCCVAPSRPPMRPCVVPGPHRAKPHIPVESIPSPRSGFSPGDSAAPSRLHLLMMPRRPIPGSRGCASSPPITPRLVARLLPGSRRARASLSLASRCHHRMTPLASPRSEKNPTARFPAVAAVRRGSPLSHRQTRSPRVTSRSIAASHDVAPSSSSSRRRATASSSAPSRDPAVAASRLCPDSRCLAASSPRPAKLTPPIRGEPSPILTKPSPSRLFLSSLFAAARAPALALPSGRRYDTRHRHIFSQAVPA
ncbi:hypothetical protein DAI22_11g081000 [Oryza sativa Japonica Group]|nr:hypothetical protein DAI22_11g081000 [Oryza sativa Japonica Group]